MPSSLLLLREWQQKLWWIAFKCDSQEEAKSSQSYQKAKVIETTSSDGKKEKKAVTEDGEVIYLGFSKE